MSEIVVSVVDAVVDVQVVGAPGPPGGGSGGGIVSVNGDTGPAVVLDANDVGAAPIVHTHTKADVGLANVDNTTDAAKPVSTATQTALNLKADTTALALKADITYVDARTPKIIVLGPTDPVPGGTPAGTVIIRKAS